MEYQNIKYSVEGRTAYIILNNPGKLNVLSNQAKAELDDVLRIIERDDNIWGLIIGGEGKAFSAGTDISEFPTRAEETRKIAAFSQQIMNRIENLHMPVIAAINGLAMGGGLELALACDIRVASEKAKMGLVEVKVGAMPCYGGIQRLCRLVGIGKAKELIFMAKVLTADEAKELGIVNHVVPAGMELEKAKEIMQTILQNAPLSVAYSKECLNRVMEIDMLSAQNLEQTLVSMLVASDDLVEGSHAFLEKRIPVYQKK